MEDLYLGADGGGTNLRVVIINSAGQVVSKASGNSANPFSVGDKAIVNLTEVTINCIKNIPGNSVIQTAVFALGGASTRSYAKLMQERILESPISSYISGNIAITNDTFAALWEGAAKLPAIALVAGTGSHCLGITDTGMVHRSSGMEYLLSDEGGAYFIGAAILRAVMRSSDGRGQTTKLKDALFNYLGIHSISDLYNYIYSVDSIKQKVANFAILATELADSGDPIAEKIIVDAANDLADLVDAVVNRLGLLDSSFQLVTIGGLFDNAFLLKEKFVKRMLSDYPKIIINSSSPNAAIGAAKIARDNPLYDIWKCYE